ncbi:MAG: hypothetical protein A2W91_14665 [Bacteroidetes bacterium GWF2_38_335]|nr:MAG: hypothetical protein A2W91_14665 [Bacteroidetes bacterium GWF2_38_335]OFY78445.1 MAG: hypothetical protein A2281_15975 [Bacteroidetes bacterium RIFOXYA12_FULL_38_20]HBS88390.1 hypothetical protein [Bacteroidales bacterium]
MRIIFISTVLLFFQLSLIAQENNHVVVGASFQKVLYIGVDNPLEIVIPGEKCSDISATISDGTLTSLGNGKYNVVVKNRGLSTIYISLKSELIDSIVFKIKRIPDPILFFGHLKQADKINIDTLTAGEVFANSPEGFDYECNWKIVKFQIRVAIDSVSHREFCEGSKLTAKQIELMKSQKSGNYIVIDEIYSIDPLGETRRLVPMVLMVE